MLIHLPRRRRRPVVNSLRHRLAGVVVALGCALIPPADAQSGVAASVEVPVAVVSALAEGGRFVITGIAASGAVVAVTISGVGLGASFVVHLSAEAAKGLAIGAGVVVEAVVVSGGWLLMAAGEALCFIADEATRPHVHSRRLGA